LRGWGFFDKADDVVTSRNKQIGFGVENTLHAKLMGNLSLLDATGVDRTPGGQKARGLIGLLAMTPDRTRTRRWIEQKLWSDRSPEQASSSLRQVLMEVRAALGPHAAALQTDRQSVTLASVKTDIDNDPEGVRLALSSGFELLQNVHVRDAAFMDWLRDQRDRMAGTAPLVKSGWQPDAPSIPLLVRTAVMPTDFCGFVALSLAESIGKLVSDFALVDVYAENTAIAHLGPRERGLVLNVTTSEVDSRVRIVASLESARTGQVLWSRQAVLPIKSTIEIYESAIPGIVFEAAEAAIHAMPRIVGDDPSPLRAEAMIARAVRAIFSFQEHQLRLADDLLRDAAAIVPSARAFAWRGILRQFMAVERTETDRDRLMDEAEMFSRQAMDGAPMNSLVLSLMSQVQIMLYDNVDAGASLARDAIRINPQNAFGYVAKAGSLLRQGKPDEAFLVADVGAGFAARSGFLHWWEMHKGLAATQMGDFETAITCFEAARSRAPHFRAPLRHLIFLYLKRGQPENALRALASLKRLEPDFSLHLIREDPTYPAGTLRRAALLSLPFPTEG
jgi:DNA-binding SARP family transcriptional activator